MSLNRRIILSATLVLVIFITLTALALETEDASAATNHLHGQLERILGVGPMTPDGLRASAELGESLIILATEPEIADLAEKLIDSYFNSVAPQSGRQFEK